MIIGASDALTGSGPIVGESVMTLSAPLRMAITQLSVTIQSYTLYGQRRLQWKQCDVREDNCWY